MASLVGLTMGEMERGLILETLKRTTATAAAAAVLGITIRTLRNKLRDYAAQGVAVPRPAAGVAA